MADIAKIMTVSIDNISNFISIGVENIASIMKRTVSLIYTSPAGDNTNFTFVGGYTPPAGDDVDFWLILYITWYNKLI